MTYNSYIKVIPTYEFHGLTEMQYMRLEQELGRYNMKRDIFEPGVKNHLNCGGFRSSDGKYCYYIELNSNAMYADFFPTSRDLSDPEYEKLIAEMDTIVNELKALIEQEEP